MPPRPTTRVLLAALPLAVVLAMAASGRPSPGLLALGAAWLSWVVGRERWSRRSDPTTWGGNPVLRGRHPGRCALLVEVDDAAAARRLVPVLQDRGAGATFFVPATEAELAGELHAAGFEVGALGRAEGAGLWRSAAARPSLRELRGGGTLVGHSIRLGPRSTDLEAARVVGTDLVVIRASTPPAAVEGWLKNWEARAVRASSLREAL